MPGQFSDHDAGRIAKTGRAFEGNRGSSPNVRSPFFDAVGFMVFQLGDALYENGRAIASPQGHNVDDNSWATETVEPPILVRGWHCDGKKWAAGKEALCFYLGGRWFWMIPEDCGEDIAEGDAADAAAQEEDYDDAGYL